MRRRAFPVLAAALALGLCLLVPALSPAQGTVPFPLHTDYGKGEIVDVPDDIPHLDGAMVDDRIVPDLRYLANRYRLFVVEGYAGPLAGVGHVGCRRCHVSNSDHYRGLAVDLVPLRWDGRGCDRSWRRTTRLAKWAEPRQNYPRLPFRWVGYNGDYNHGCGNHLHLSWDYAPTKRYHVADWVDVFDPPSPKPVDTPTQTSPPARPFHERS
jgi:hypothetical protein